MVQRDIYPGSGGLPPGTSTDSRRTRLVAAGALALLIAMAAVAWLFMRGEDDTTTAAPGAQNSSTSALPSDSASPAAPGKASASPGTAKSASDAPSSPEHFAPNATFTNTCRYVLGDSTEKTPTGLRLVAQSKIVNTGNTGIEVEVQASWSQGEGERITETKRVRVDLKKSRTVHLSVPVTNKEIDLIRRHTGPDANCKVEPTIVATY